MNINILGISEPKKTGIGKFNSDDHYIYYNGQSFLRRNGVALTVNRRVWNAVLGCSLRNTDWSLFISKANHSVSQSSKSMPQPAMPKMLKLNGSMKIDNIFWSYHREKRCPFHHRGLECKSRNSKDTQENKQIWPQSTKWSRKNRKIFCQDNMLIIASTLFQQFKRLHRDITRRSMLKSDWLCSL